MPKGQTEYTVPEFKLSSVIQIPSSPQYSPAAELQVPQLVPHPFGTAPQFLIPQSGVHDSEEQNPLSHHSPAAELQVPQLVPHPFGTAPHSLIPQSGTQDTTQIPP